MNLFVKEGEANKTAPIEVRWGSRRVVAGIRQLRCGSATPVAAFESGVWIPNLTDGARRGFFLSPSVHRFEVEFYCLFDVGEGFFNGLAL